MGKQNLITLQLLAVTGILLSILVSLLAFRFFSLPSSKADLRNQTAQNIQPPYLRLIPSQYVSDDPNMILVDVMANTGGQVVNAADAVIEYNPAIIAWKADSQLIRWSDALSVHSAQLVEPGKILLSAFSSPERGESLLNTNADQEYGLVTLAFEKVDKEAAFAQLNLVFIENSLDDSNLILATEERPETPSDILSAIEGLTIQLRKVE